MAILLTGASGFIGNALFKKITNLSLPVKVVPGRFFLSTPFKLSDTKNFIYENINQNIKLAEFFSGISTIIHCAGLKPNNLMNYEDFKKINIELTFNLAKQAAFYNVKRLIYLSSTNVNGSSNINSLSFKYDDIPQPKDHYAISKFETEKVLLEISKQTGLEIVIIRPPLVYGEELLEGTFLSLLNIVYKQIPMPILNLKYTRAFIGLDNLIDVIIRCINYPNLSGKILLVSDGEDISVCDLVKKLSKMMRKSVKLFSFPELILKPILNLIGKSAYTEKLFNSYKVDISYTRKILQWSPRFTLDEQLKKTVDWYLKN
jgi:nucleoside-diphosphate-sugar epimerase